MTKGKHDFDGTIDGTGYKGSMDDPHKTPLSLVPPLFVHGVAEVLRFGAQKYARGQWMRGIPFSEVLDAMQRHTAAITAGEELDAESGLPHVYHVGTCAAFLAWFQHGPRAAEYRRFDDRLYKPPAPVVTKDPAQLDLLCGHRYLDAAALLAPLGESRRG